MTTPPPEQTIPLNTTRGMLRRLAEAEILEHGEYLCMVDGKRTRVVDDTSPTTD